MLLLIGIFGETPTRPPVAQPQPSGSTTEATSPPTSATTPPATTPATTAATTTSPPPVTIPPTTVVVLNSTGVAGLAGRVSEHLGGLGWQVGTPDNFAPTLDVTTVYYPEGLEAEARLLAAAAPGDADTVAPVIPEVGADVLTVVVGTDAEAWVAPVTSSPPAG